MLPQNLGLLRSYRPISEIKEAPAFSASSAPVTRKLNFAEITANLSKHQSQISKKRQSFPNVSALVTCTLGFAEITVNLSKRRSQISKKRQSFFSLVSTCHMHTRLCGNHGKFVEASI
ncbi:hypothetical protein ACFXTH_010052 [Malus domestica]